MNPVFKFTLLLALLSPLAVNTFDLELIASMDARNWLMLVISAPIVWYAGWVFIAGAWTSLPVTMASALPFGLAPRHGPGRRG